MANNDQNIRVSYAQTVYGREEIAAIHRVLGDPSKIVPGERVREFEEKVAKLFSKKYGVMVNSGSSANLLAVEAMGLPPGSEVITPVLTFATTVTPLVQKGLIPVFVDVEEGTYQVNVDQLERVISPKTRAVVVPSLIGNLPDLARIRAITKKHNLFFIEDSCDTLGSRFGGKSTGVYSDISTTSFYASHIITAAGSGGMVCVNDLAIARRVRVMAAWGRDSTLFGAHEKSEDIKKRFAGRLAGDTYDAKFIFSELGYNFQPTELNAAFGLEQLKRLNSFTLLRKKRFAELQNFFHQYENLFILPKQHSYARSNWLAFPVVLKPYTMFTRAEITKHLEDANIQTRPIFTGTILQQPAFQNVPHRKGVSRFPVSDYIMRNGFLIGAHHGLTDEHMRHLKKTIRAFLTAHQ